MQSKLYFRIQYKKTNSMAILGKIRQRSFFLILVIGLALFAFVISGAFGNGSGDTGPNEPIGVVNGEEIPLEKTLDFLSIKQSVLMVTPPCKRFKMCGINLCVMSFSK